ncbi:DUF1841 family protein [Caldichromatium japonicum]|uniref:DUF1841 family protein n=1 Tax=Caldichromatium japonicum TaxID=2699430 RepID=A0A6G7VAF5_9GAMM|nr:DUF1841 family protein [Caldichromatium japonicum]QIK37053.1 DUF1841 family protein [Caldichromatium japonicum]
MPSSDRSAHRRVILEAWRKAQEGEVLNALDAQIVAVIHQHPEYHALLDDPAAAFSDTYPPDGPNPFLHLGLHLAILDQLSIDQPPGIRSLYQRLLGCFGDTHQVEHRIMDCLAELLWQAQRQGTQPDNSLYLDCIRRLVK